ncbi:MAG: hypothetical protein U1E45_16605 [Geminicoccaceae bacterium]
MLSRYLEVLMTVGLILLAIIATRAASADIDALCVAGSDVPCTVVRAAAPMAPSAPATGIGL